jgi:O-antigen/teichoic acid export membrane protein
MAAIPTHPENTARQSPNLESRVFRGILAMFLRQGLAYGAIFFGNIFLARWLSVSEYGVFAAILALQATIVAFSDLGLGPALIQRDTPPTSAELASLFTVQLLLFSTVAAIVWVAAPLTVAYIDIGNDSVLLVRTLALVLVIPAFRSIPALMLERELRFGPIATAEAVSTIAYQCLLLALVAFGA